MNTEREVGAHIDLFHLNKERSLEVQKKTVEIEEAEHPHDIGTRYTLKFVNDQLKAFRRIPVAAA